MVKKKFGANKKFTVGKSLGLVKIFRLRKILGLENIGVEKISILGKSKPRNC